MFKAKLNFENIIVGYYDSIQKTVPTKHLNRFEIYRQMMIDSKLQQDTEYILRTFKDSIVTGIKDPEYQKTKTKLLPAVCFSISGNREGNNTGIHTGIINFDIDENSTAELIEFRKKLENIPFIEAAARSVSGALNGSLWVNIRVNIPTEFSSIPPAYIKQFKLTEKKYITQLHEYYYSVFSADMLNDYSIKIGKSKRDLKRARYLSYDENIYINQDARYLDFGHIAQYLADHKEEQQEQEYSRIIGNINESNAFSYAEQFAHQHTGNGCVKGNQHSYVTMLSIALNRLGITENEARNYVKFKYNDITISSNCFSPFKTYKSDFGVWSHLIPEKKQGIEFNWFSPEGKRHYFTDALKHHNIEYKNILGHIVTPATGYGKTSILLEIHKSGEPIAQIMPTINASEQAYNEALKQGIRSVLFTGANDLKKLNLSACIDDLPMIFCTYASFSGLDRFLMNLSKNYNLVADEIHAATADNIYFERINNLLDAQHRYKSFTALTATPLLNLHPVLKAMPRFDVIINDKPRMSAKIVRTKNTDKTAARLYREAISEGKTPFVYMNDTGDRLQNFIDLVSDITPIIFNSTTKESDAFRGIVKDKIFSGNYGFVGTAVFDFATSITNISNAVVIFAERVHPDDKAIQIPNRCRDANIETVFLMGIENYKASILKTGIKEGDRLSVEAENRAEAFNNNYDAEYHPERERLQGTLLRTKSGEFIADYLKVSYKVYENQKMYYYSTPERLNARLLINGFDVSGIVCADDVLTEGEKLNKKLKKQERENRKEQIFNEIVETLTLSIAPEQTAARMSADTKDKYTQRLLKGFLGIYNIIPDDMFNAKEKRAEALNKFEETKGKGIKLLIDKIRLSDMDFSFDTRKFSDQIILKIQECKPYTTAELKTIVCDCLLYAQGIDRTEVERLRNQQRASGILKLIKPYFECKRKGKKKDSYEFTRIEIDWKTQNKNTAATA
jgi:hypothetical protein